MVLFLSQLVLVHVKVAHASQPAVEVVANWLLTNCCIVQLLV